MSRWTEVSYANIGGTTVQVPATTVDGTEELVWARSYGSAANLETDDMYERELQLRDLNEQLGCIASLPYCEMVGGLLVYEHVDGTCSGQVSGETLDSSWYRKARQGLALLDHVVGQNDRHGGNWLVDEERRLLWALDNVEFMGQRHSASYRMNLEEGDLRLRSAWAELLAGAKSPILLKAQVGDVLREKVLCTCRKTY